jgi:hypothetical protein
MAVFWRHFLRKIAIFDPKFYWMKKLFDNRLKFGVYSSQPYKNMLVLPLICQLNLTQTGQLY